MKPGLGAGSTRPSRKTASSCSRFRVQGDGLQVEVVAVGLNGSGIGTALGAAAGGAALAAGGRTAPAVTAAVIGLLAIAAATTAVRRA